jgi:hypothetical protein
MKDEILLQIKNEHESRVPDVDKAHKLHINNYRNLIQFLENIVRESITDNKVNGQHAIMSCMKCIRFLDKLIASFDAEQQARHEKLNLINTLLNDPDTVETE